MKLSEVVGLRPVLEKIAAKEMDGAAALEFANFAKNILVEIQNFEMKRAELFQKYGEEVTEGDQKGLKISAENEKKFNAAIKRALGKDLKIEPFDIAALGITFNLWLNRGG
jgi:hypothetical protein